MKGMKPRDITFDDMPKTKENPLGINVLVCPLCKNQSFFGMSRTETVKHFWECVEDCKRGGL